MCGFSYLQVCSGILSYISVMLQFNFGEKATASSSTPVYANNSSI